MSAFLASDIGLPADHDKPRIARPLSIEQACAPIEECLALPVVRPIVPGTGHWAVFRSLLAQCGGCNLTSDAHIAALALGPRYTVYSTDHDFGRFRGLRHINPLLG